MRTATTIAIQRKGVAAFCRRHRIVRLSLFGSVLRDDFGPHSDVDVLVDFELGAVPSILGMVELQDELSRLFGRPVDLRTAAELSRQFRAQVRAEAVDQYVAA